MSTVKVRSTWREMAAVYATGVACGLAGFAVHGAPGASLAVASWVVGLSAAVLILRSMGRRVSGLP